MALTTADLNKLAHTHLLYLAARRLDQQIKAAKGRNRWRFFSD